jgi:hypothetical protein
MYIALPTKLRYPFPCVNERYGLTLRGEGFNIVNHANTFLNNGGNNDASIFNYALSYKTGRRRVQLAAKLSF